MRVPKHVRIHKCTLLTYVFIYACTIKYFQIYHLRTNSSSLRMDRLGPGGVNTCSLSFSPVIFHTQRLGAFPLL